MERAHKQEWPQLEKDTASRLIYRNPSCYFGKGKTFEKYLDSIANRGLDIEILEPSYARQVFPQFRFANSQAVLRDQTGGVIAAEETLRQLKRLIISRGVQLYENTKVLSIDDLQDPIQINTSQETFYASRLVLTTGSWIQQFLPKEGSMIVPIRQTVAYFKLEGLEAMYQIGQFPNWAFIGDGENEVYYGLPQFQSKGIKVARHVSIGKSDDPNVQNALPDPSQIADLEKFIEQQFVYPKSELIKAETCMYANTPNENFIIDLLPKDPRIAIGAVCSGHGFKFAPLTGRILSELILNGKTSIPEFEEARDLFSLKEISY